MAAAQIRTVDQFLLLMQTPLSNYNALKPVSHSDIDKVTKLDRHVKTTLCILQLLLSTQKVDALPHD